MVEMDFWDSYKKRAVATFGSAQLHLSTGERWNTSVAMVSDRGIVLELNNALLQGYGEASRYLVAKDINYDLLVLVYDVNSRSSFAARITAAPDSREWSRIASLIGRIGNPNFEFRFIGLQNGYTAPLDIVDNIHKKFGGRVMEFDLFGTDTRHIAVDMKTGVPYNLLLLNRIYRAGELANQVKMDDFQKKVSKLVFI